MKTIIEMAREAGLIVDANQSGFDSVEAFAALVRADEREESAKFFDDNEAILFWGSTVAEHIRARGQA